MRTIHIPTIIAAALLAAIPTGATAQNRSALLTSVDVSRLVANGQPADHAQLREHFTALANKYTTDARRYREMARVISGNPNHPPAVPPGARWTRLAESAELSAATLRQLSAHHDRLAAGQRSEAPDNGGRFETGYGAPAPTDTHVREVESSARTRADHESLAQYFDGVADTQSNAARKYAAAAQAFRGPIGQTTAGALAAHYELMAQRSREAVRQARGNAAKHRQLAQGD